MARTNSKWITPLDRERASPWILALVVGLAAWFLHGAAFISLPVQSPDSYLSAVISLGGVLTGFMATLKALLYAMSDTAYRRLKCSGYLEDLLRYLREALWGSVLMCVVALIAFYLPKSVGLHSIVAGVSAFALSSVARIASITTKLLAVRPIPEDD